MLTVRNGGRILEVGECGVVALTKTGLKFHYREYSTGEGISDQLRILSTLQQSTVIKVYKVCTDDIVAAYFQHYVGTLNQYVGANAETFDQEEIINTFLPVLDAVECLLGAGYPLTLPTLQNIGITEEGDIKYITDVLFSTQVRPASTQEQIHEALVLLVSKLLVRGGDFACRKWKIQLSNLKHQISQKNYNFFVLVYDRALQNIHQPSKTKKIVKKSRPALSKYENLKKKDTFGRSTKIPSFSQYEGKQNKIKQ